ncbi:unnamed protein product [Musa acuminata subsp. burmannicoides]
MAEISEEAQEQQYTSFSSSSSSPIAVPQVDPDEESLASVPVKKSPMPFLEAANAEKWVKDAAQRTESDAPAQRSKSSDKAATKAEQSKLSVHLYRPVKTEDCFWSIGWTIHFYTFDQAKSDGMVEILQKMMFEQWQKAMGLQTSDDM